MIGFGFWDSSNNGLPGVNDYVLNLLDFPMESLEGDGHGEDLDAIFRRLGPITWEALQKISTNPTLEVRNGSSDLQSNSSTPSKQTCQLNMKPEFVEETEIIDNSSISKEQVAAPLEPCSPISTLSGSGSCSSRSGEKNTPISQNPPPSGIRKSQRKKRNLRQLYAVKQRPPKQQPTFTRKCMHCEITKTPQWRDGPLGANTLCNACGVQYRTGRLLPEYRPAASPTFVPSLHSNNHKKIVEMRSGSNESALVKENEGAMEPKSEKIWY